MMKEEFPEVLDFARLYMIENCILGYEDQHFNINKLFLVDPLFLSLFSWELVQGDPLTALNDPLTVVLTESAAKRYFGEENPVGKTLIYSDNEHQEQLTVSGVMKDVPPNSYIHFDVLLSYATAIESWNWELTWSHNDDYIYLLLAPHTDIENLKAKFPAFRKYMPENDKSRMLYNQ